MPLVDALEVLTEEGRFYDDEIIGERFLTLWSGGVRMGKPNSVQNGTNLVVKSVLHLAYKKFEARISKY